MRAPFRLSAFAFAAFVAGFAVAALLPQIFNDGDTWWHLAAGDWMLAHRSVPSHDIFTYTFAGQPWDAQEWLSEILMALVFRLDGWNGIHILFGLAFGTTAAIVAGTLRRQMDFIPALLMATLGLACVTGSLLARPHILALPLMAFWTVTLVRVRADGRAPPLGLAAVMLVWANLHGSFAFGLALAAALGIEATLEEADRRRAAKQWGVFFGLALSAAAVTPQGLYGLWFPVKLLAMPALGNIGEWAPSDFAHLTPFLLALLAMIFVLTCGRIKLPAIRALIILGLVYLALTHARHQMLFGVVAPLLAASAVGAAWPAKPYLLNPWPMRSTVALLATLIVVTMARPVLRGDDGVSPMTALAHVPAGLRRQPVLNAYEYGGYLIFSGIKVFIDSRADLYSTPFLKNYSRLAAGDSAALTQTLAQDHIAWTIFPKTSKAAATLDQMPGWHRAYADGLAVIHRRDEPRTARAY